MKASLFPFLLLICLFSFSCSNFVKGYHERFDSEQNEKRGKAGSRGLQFSKFKESNRDPSSDRKNFLDKRYNTNSTSTDANQSPLIKRNYQRVPNKRYTKEDLRDNENIGSLWSGEGQPNYLFSKNNEKRHGDIVVIKVMEKLKNDISYELKRNYPLAKKKKQKEEKKPEENADQADNTKVYDKISGLVIEEVAKDHVIVRGRKEVLFRNRRRYIEVKAMMARRDIADDDSVLSNRLLEHSVTVIR